MESIILLYGFLIKIIGIFPSFCKQVVQDHHANNISAGVHLYRVDLTVIDVFSKYAFAIGLEDKTAEVVSKGIDTILRPFNSLGVDLP
jgi:CRISPR/Cas system CSM-associated protein Csm4 (group 5 of RAMP superfamily)